MSKSEESEESEIYIKLKNFLSDPHKFKETLDSLSKDECHNALKHRYEDDNTLLHMAIIDDKKSCITVIVNKLLQYKLLDVIGLQNSEGNTVLHLEVIYEAGIADMLRCMLKDMLRKDEPKPRFLPDDSSDVVEYIRTVIGLPNSEGNTVLHLAVLETNKNAWGVFLKIVSKDKRYEVLMLKNNDGNSVLHLAVLGCVSVTGMSKAVYEVFSESVEDAVELRRVSRSVLRDAVMLENKKKNDSPLCFSVLHLAIFYEDLEFIEIILKNFSPDIWVQESSQNRNALHFAAANEVLITKILRTLSKSQILDAVIVKDQLGFTPLHWAAKAGKVACIEEILKHFTPEQCLKAVVTLNDLKRNMLHYAADKVECIKVILEKVGKNSEELLKAFMTQDLSGDGDTPLHLAAKAGNVACIEAIVEHLTPEQCLKVGGALNGKGNTVGHILAEHPSMACSKILDKLSKGLPPPVDDAKTFLTSQGCEKGITPGGHAVLL